MRDDVRRSAVEHDSEHTIAQSIVKSAEERALRLPKGNRFEALPGRGVQAVVDGRTNDAPALLTADVGIAIGAGMDVAVEAGDVVLLRSDPRDVHRVIALSKATYRKMIQNLWWTAGLLALHSALSWPERHEDSEAHIDATAVKSRE